MKQAYLITTILSATLSVACGEALDSLSPTAPSAASRGSSALSNGPNQAPAPGCTPPDGADTHFSPAPPGSTPGTDQPSCETGNEDGSGPSLNTGGTPPTNPTRPPQTEIRPKG
jgi:hypothetical protein